MRVRYVHLCELVVNANMSVGTGKSTCGATKGLFVSEDYSAVTRGGVSVPRFVVVGCSICVSCAMLVCEIFFCGFG